MSSASPVKRPSRGAWEWQADGRGRGVRAFPSTGRLIWSSWMVGAQGIQFDDGVAQSFASYLSGAPTPFPVPPLVAEELRAFLGSG